MGVIWFLGEPQNNTDAHGSGSVCRPAEAGPLGPRLDESIPSGRTRVGVRGVLPGGMGSSATRASRGSQRGGPCLSVASLKLPVLVWKNHLPFLSFLLFD